MIKHVKVGQFVIYVLVYELDRYILATLVVQSQKGHHPKRHQDLHEEPMLKMTCH